MKAFLLILLLPVICLAQKDPFERFVSLGNGCITRFQIDHHLTKRFDKSKKKFGGGQLFDWMTMQDYDKLADALENQLADLFELSDLVVITENIQYVKNIKYDMTWNHLFTRNAEGSVAENVLEIEYEIKKQKINYLSEKFRQLRDYRTLYIISYPFQIGTMALALPEKNSLVRVRNALEKLRGNDNFAILYCTVQKSFDKFDNIYVKEITPWDKSQPYTSYYYEEWDAILSKFPFSTKHLTVDKSGLDDTY